MENPLTFANTESAARERYERFKSIDPFPEVDRALLSSADIYDYILQVGIVWPFEESYLKPATYALTVGGPYVLWEDGKKIEGNLENGRYLTIKKDSILFITLEPLIQLPIYIAARFNLKIDHVYKGLLLGTGPIVDPGFVGRLSIPLHNFTSNDYLIKGGEKFIWMEFTKLSSHSVWDRVESRMERKGNPVPYKSKGKERVLDDYIYEADKRPIESSIPLSVTRSENSAKEAEKSAKKMEDFMKVVLTLNFAIIAAVLTLVWNVYNQTSTLVTNSESELNKYQDELKKKDALKLDQLQTQIDSLKMVFKENLIK